MAKQLKYSEEARRALERGVNHLADLNRAKPGGAGQRLLCECAGGYRLPFTVHLRRPVIVPLSSRYRHVRLRASH